MSDTQDISIRRAQLNPAQQAKLRQRLQAKGTTAAHPVVIGPREPGSPAYLSYAQCGLWLTWKLAPESPAYNLAGSLRLQGELNLAALQASLNAVIARHEILRSVIVDHDSEAPTLHPLPSQPIKLDGVRLEDRGVALDEALRGFAARPYALDREAPVRVELYQLNPSTHVLALGVHHIAADGWSLRLLVDEILAYYACAARGEPDPLPALAIQFSDYAAWERARLDGAERARQIAYWRDRLGDDHTCLDLPSSRPRAARGLGREGRHHFFLSPDLTTTLRALARGQGASVFVMMMALLDILLHRLSGQSRIRVGTPLANRHHIETHGLIGYLLNLQVLQITLSGDASFLAVLRQVREALVGAQENQDLSFDALVDALQPERQSGVHPLFQVKCTQQDDMASRRRAADLEVDIEVLNAGQAHFDLSLDFTDRQDGIACVFAYDADLYDATLIAAYAQAFLACAQQAIEAPQRPIREFQLSAAGELIGPLRRYPHAHVLSLWDAAREKNPHALALRCEERTLDYAALDTAANALAARIQGLGICAESRVGVYAHRSLEGVIAMLAVLKAGAVYMPMDPALPAQRLAYQLSDSGAKLLLYAQRPSWTPAVACQAITLDEPPQAGEGGLEPPRHPDQAAYLLYTSGSTGKPKGVTVSHAALANYVQAVLDAMALPESVRSLAMVSTVAADLGHTALFGALLSGRQLHLLDADCVFDPDRFAHYMRTHNVDVLKIVPSHLQALLSASRPADVLPRACLALGGEATSWPLVERIARLRPELRLLNHYGPTETTVGALTQVASAALREAASLPIGRPLANTQAHVLDVYGQPVLDGVPGELYIGGAGLARGYEGRPGQTAERFVANPFSETGERLYRTGDRVRRLHGGSLEFLGRVDDQVKIRGYRVELREVAQMLKAQDGVLEAEVLAREGEDGQRRLLGYVVAKAGSVLDSQELKAQLGQRLPDYMVPAAIMVLAALPLTANGKVDRKALPEPGQQNEENYEAPQGEIETALAEVWAEVLHREKVGRNDNFFEIGGDSILSLQIVARTRKRGYRITPKQLMESQTVAALAAQAVPLKAAAQPVQVDEPVGEWFALTPVQQWFFEQNFAAPHHWNMSMLLATIEVVDAVVLKKVIEAVVLAHPALRLQFVKQGDKWLQSLRPVDMHSLFAVAEIEGGKTASAQIARIAEAAQKTLDLTQPFKALWLVQKNGRGGRLLLLAHHLVVDAVSWRIIIDDMQRACKVLLAGNPVEISSEDASFRDWIRELDRFAKMPELLAEIPFWEEILGQREDLLPMDHGSSINEVHCARSLEFSLDEDLTQQLLFDVPQAYRTPINEVLLAALAMTLCEWSARESVLIELEGHGREQISKALDFSRTVGWFTSLVPVRLEIGKADIAQSLKLVKETLRRIPNKGIGYGVLRYLNQEANAFADRPYPQVTFNYLGQFDQVFEEDGMWRPARESAGADRSATSRCRAVFDIVGQLYRGQLSIRWTYSAALHEDSTVRGLLDSYRSNLETLIEHCTSGVVGVTPSDFPLAKVSQIELDRLPVPIAALEDLYPLSPMQSGMLFHSLYNEAGTAYVNQLRLDVDGLDSVRFRAAWQKVIARHEILRTGFLTEASEPLQWVSREAAVPLAEYDWRGQENLSSELDLLAGTELAQGFDLARPPLMRLVLVRTGEKHHHFIWMWHHLLIDGWSISRLMSEVMSAYAGNMLPDRTGCYRDYIDWLQGQNREDSRAYWQGLTRPLDEPTRLVGALGEHGARTGYASYGVELAPTDTARLEAFARAERVTVNTLVQAVWSYLLSRYTGQRTVAFGVTVAGRPAELPGAEQMLGLFINTLPVVDTAAAGQCVGDWLRDLQVQNLASREHEYVPLYEIQRWAGQGGQGLFDTIVVFENYPVDKALHATGPEDPVFGKVVSRGETNYPLTVVVEHDRTVQLKYDYIQGVFSDEAVREIAEHTVRLLWQLPQMGQRRVGEIDLVLGDEGERLTSWSVNGERHVDMQPIHRLIESQVLARPQAVALVFGEEALSYADLNTRANRLAHRLIALGVAPEGRVGVALERATDLVVSLLAILKAGGAYVPLDPDYPAERLAYMVGDSGIGLLLTHSTLRDRLSTINDVRMLEVDGLDLSCEPGINPAVSVSGDNLCYVIYTSGSTGKPKGAANRHRSLYNRLRWMQQAYALDAGDTVLQKTPYSFDVSVWEFFWPLMTGARLAVSNPGDHRDPARLVEQIRENRVTTLHFVPLMLRAFLEHPGIAACTSLKRIVCSGEALPVEVQAAVFARLPGVTLYNLYGPTEAAIDVTHWTCRDDGNTQVPIGKPISDTKTYVLDSALNLVPQGVAGELYLGGVGLARGYLNRAVLTAERFVADPFSLAGERLYRTGDWVKWNAEGALEYLGRIDHQVKIRGFRIELGEIEAKLLAYPEVREAVVVAAAGPGGTRLVGYVSLHTLIDVAQLREQLGQALPDYMVPSVILVLDALPLNANGKIDRKALPAPEVRVEGEYEAPVGEVEAALAGIWSDVLQVPLEKVGRQSNFFELGGDSISVLKAQMKTMQRLGVRLGLRAYFGKSRLRDIGDQIDEIHGVSDKKDEQEISVISSLLQSWEE